MLFRCPLFVYHPEYTTIDNKCMILAKGSGGSKEHGSYDVRPSCLLCVSPSKLDFPSYSPPFPQQPLYRGYFKKNKKNIIMLKKKIVSLKKRYHLQFYFTTSTSNLVCGSLTYTTRKKPRSRNRNRMNS